MFLQTNFSVGGGVRGLGRRDKRMPLTPEINPVHVGTGLITRPPHIHNVHTNEKWEGLVELVMSHGRGVNT